MNKIFNTLAILVFVFATLVKGGIGLCEKNDGSIVFEVMGLSSGECCDHEDEKNHQNDDVQHLESPDCEDIVIQISSLVFHSEIKSLCKEKINSFNFFIYRNISSYCFLYEKWFSLKRKPPDIILTNSYLDTRESVILIV